MAVYGAQLGSRAPFAQAPQLPAHVPPPGTFLPGTKVQVGSLRVIIDRYLSEGGFAHVYVVKLPQPIDGVDKAVLKRVAVPDKGLLANLRTEVETMKRLRGQKHIVKYIDSHASQLKGGGYEVFLLMEFCSGGGLIDFMNTRLQNRLTEPEIVKIFTDVAEGVARMHYLKPPLLHRDLKVENVLISKSGSSTIYKLCDFGSAAQPRPAATNAAEGRLIEDDVQRHTTLQYRSPEMIDVYRKQPIDEKSDIWALGVFLYKLCYYTTPFEEVGQMAILNASFKYPGYPRFSDDMKLLIASMLRENPTDRPNIYQVLQKACKMDKRELPVLDIYTDRTASEHRSNQVMPPLASSIQSRAGASLAPPKQEAPTQSLPDIAPMRRGRPTRPVSHHGSAKPSPSPLRVVDNADPFRSLDGGKLAGGDELSSRFPTLDEFSLLTDKGKKFAFDAQVAQQTETKEPDLADRVTAALADDAFARPASPPDADPQAQDDLGKPAPSVVDRKKVVGNKTLEERKRVPPKITPKPMVSTGTMTSPSPPPSSIPSISDRPMFRVSSHEPPKPRTSSNLSRGVPAITSSKSVSRLASLLKQDATQSQAVIEQGVRSPISSRPSLEGGRPAMRDLDMEVNRSRSLNIRDRPVSVNIGARPTHIKDKEIKKMEHVPDLKDDEPEMPPLVAVESDTNIESDIDFLRAREKEERERNTHAKRLSSGSRHLKRSSLPSMAVTGTKSLAGRFGDAFKMFEGGHGRDRSMSPAQSRLNVLTPVAGSEATDLSDDRQGLEETEDLSPEMRRELEKRQLEAEERRVEMAAAEYRQRLVDRGGSRAAGVAKATSIQNRVQSLLKDNDRPNQKTAAGYGRFTAEPDQLPPRPPEKPRGYQIGRKTVAPPHKSMSAPPSAINLITQEPRIGRPAAPPKPRMLQTASSRTTNGAAGNSEDDWEAQFSQRYPTLSGLEMVETDLDTAETRPARTVKEV